MIAFSGSWFKRRGAMKKAVAEAYGRLLREALMPVHYETRGVPDTFEGRGQMVTLMTALACDRLAASASPQAAEMAEALNARVLDGFEVAFREKGVGDHSIARKVRAMAETHSGLGQALMAALRETDSPENGLGELENVLRRNGVTGAEAPGALAGALWNYRVLFANQPDERIFTGEFPCGGSDRAV